MLLIWPVEGAKVPEKVENSSTNRVTQEVAQTSELLAETKNKLLERGEQLSNLEEATGLLIKREKLSFEANMRNKTSDFAELAKRIKESQDKKWYQL